ncbi:L,D-transpeptidase [Bacillus taeanensis]|uniref:L,D-TPase catalytic domain-containing protein n=1 Tax=Bacillus taeanensis TaxID=273032 RepID=A0A366XUN0_9BACI|nr:L,D-transpeptidase [Bacillus taeanensis]RBW67834.1 hypothetical protein DS031_20015 [Bacillus taeanensis]
MRCKNIALHGTYDVDSIKQNKSLGCVRLKNEDIIELFHFTPKGAVVHIIDNKQLLSKHAISNNMLKRLTPNSISNINQTSKDTFYWLG